MATTAALVELFSSNLKRNGFTVHYRVTPHIEGATVSEAVYALADVVYVGGSLVPHGGQNMLEPAAQGRAVVHGPHVHNFRHEAALLASAGASLTVADGAALEKAFRTLLADDAERARMGAKALEVVAAQKGATALTLDAFVSRCLGV